MPQTYPSGDWETITAATTVTDVIVPVKTIRVWADGTITFTCSGANGKTTTSMPVFAGELIPVYGRLLNITCTANISLLR